MNDLKKKALWLSLLGFVMGVGIGLMFYWMNGPEGVLARADKHAERLLYFLLSGLYGAVNMGTSAVYGIDEWSILRCTFTHFLICVGSSVLFFGTMIAQGWMSMPPAGECALIAAAFVLIYFLIWLTQYLIFKRKTKNMNAKLRKWKNQRNK